MPRNTKEYELMKNTFTLITGTGRSGTAYTSKCLMSSGHKIPHESFGDSGIVSWYAATDKESALKSWSLKRIEDYCRYTKKELLILHQMRNPIDCISSLMTITDQSLEWIKKHEFVNISESDTMLQKCIKYYYFWNVRCATIADYSYSLRNSDDFLKQFFENFTSKNISKKTNSRNYPRLSKELIYKADPYIGSICFDLYDKLTK
jgi:hypothetical protein